MDPLGSINEIYRYEKDDAKRQIHFHPTAYHSWEISKGERDTSPEENIYGSANKERLATENLQITHSQVNKILFFQYIGILALKIVK